MRARVAARKKAAKEASFRKDAVKLAKSKVGTIETPVNIQEFGKWYGMNGVPWCAIFVSWCFAKRPARRASRAARAGRTCRTS